MATGQPIGDLVDVDETMLLTLADVHETEWTRVEHLLATIVDVLGHVAHNALIGPHVDPKGLKHLKPPAPLPRPGMERRRRGTTIGQLAAMHERRGA